MATLTKLPLTEVNCILMWVLLAYATIHDVNGQKKVNEKLAYAVAIVGIVGVLLKLKKQIQRINVFQMNPPRSTFILTMIICVFLRAAFCAFIVLVVDLGIIYCISDKWEIFGLLLLGVLVVVALEVCQFKTRSAKQWVTLSGWICLAHVAATLGRKMFIAATALYALDLALWSHSYFLVPHDVMP